MIVRAAAALAFWFALGLAMLDTASAQSPDDAAVDAARAEALALNKAGAALAASRDWAGALDKFQQAYAAFPSPKVLKNIGEMLRELGRFADAANVYQRWLDDPGAEAAKRTEVTKVLATLDQSLGVLVLSGAPDDVEVQVDGWNPSWQTPSENPTWRPIDQAGRVRVPAGRFTVRARKAGYLPGEVSGTVAAATTEAVTLTLVEEPEVVEPVANPVVTEVVTPLPDDAVIDEVAPPRRGIRLGGLVDIAIDGKGEGFAISPGVSVRLADRIEIDAKALIGGSAGGYVGASVYLTTGTVRPQLTIGLPVFFSDGLRVGARGGVGVSIELGDRLSVVGEIGGEYFLNPEMDRNSLVLVPIVGVHAWL